MVKAALRTTLTRRRPLWMLYLLVSLPAPIFALLLEGLPAAFARYPLLRRALSERSLDGLLELLTLMGREQFPYARGGGTATLLGFCGLLLILPLWPLLRLWLEGGILHDYAAPERPGRRAFWRACRRHFGLFARLFVVELLAAVVLSIPLVLFLYLVGRYALWAVKGAEIAAILAMLPLFALFELARTAAVMQSLESVGAALKAALRMVRRRGKAVAHLFALWLALFVGLALLWKGLTAIIPFTAWPLLFLFGQIHLLLRLFAYLWRRAMEVQLWQEAGVPPTLPAREVMDEA